MYKLHNPYFVIGGHFVILVFWFFFIFLYLYILHVLVSYTCRSVTQTELALWGSGALKAGECRLATHAWLCEWLCERFCERFCERLCERHFERFGETQTRVRKISLKKRTQPPDLRNFEFSFLINVYIYIYKLYFPICIFLYVNLY